MGAGVRKWKVLLIGGSSGVGKTMVARELAKHLSLSLLLLDDVRLALQQATSSETNPELHVFLNYQKEKWRDSESIYAD
jgi:2-phosphoglycerate kinase